MVRFLQSVSLEFRHYGDSDQSTSKATRGRMESTELQPNVPPPDVARNTRVTPSALKTATTKTTMPVPVVPVEPPEDHPAELERRPSGLTPLSLLLTLLLAYLLFKVQIVLFLLIAGILLATAIMRPVDYLHRRHDIGRGTATLLMYVVILISFGLLFYLLIPPVAREAARFAENFPELRESWRAQLLATDNSQIRNASSRLFQVVDRSAAGNNDEAQTGLAFGLAQGIGGTLVALFTTFLIAFYWINEKPLIKRAVASLFRPGQRRRALHLWNEVETKIGAWIRGQLILMAIIGTVTTIVYSPLLMDLPFWLILGVIAALTEAIPNIGPILGAIPAVLLALTLDWRLALLVVGFVVILQLVENAILVPRIMRGTVGLTPLTIILAILAGAEFRGVVGALLAIPVAGAIQVIFSDLLRERRKREVALHTRGTPPSGPSGWFGRRVLRPRGPLVKQSQSTQGVAVQMAGATDSATEQAAQ